MTNYQQSFEKCVSKIQKTQDAYNFRMEITEITSITQVPDVVFMNFTSGIFSSKTLVSI